MATLEEAIHAYMERRSYRRVLDDRNLDNSVRGLFIGTMPKGKNGVEKKLSPYALMQQDGISGYLGMEVNSPDVIEILPLAIKASVKAYTHKKPKVVTIYKDFIRFLEEAYEVNIPIDYPYLYANEFDRQMFIVKELHEKDRGVDYLEDRLWTGSVTINDDLKMLQEPETVRILGQEVTISGIEIDNGVIEFKSTVHPLFLTPNITQVVAMLDGLRVMSTNPAFKTYALPLAHTIWRELSDYGRNRILELTDELTLDKAWYEEIRKAEGGGLFMNEEQCSSGLRAENVLDFLKNRKICTLIYLDEGIERQLSHCRIVNLDYDEIIAMKDGIPLRIKMDSIIRTMGTP